MDNHRFRNLKRYVIVCLALCLVLAGTAYASVKVTQHELAGVTCGGSCPARNVFWANIHYTGVPGSLSPGPTVDQTALGAIPAQLTRVGVGSWLVYFSGRNLNNCARFAQLTTGVGYATVGQYDSTNTDKEAIPVWTYGTDGKPMDANFVVVALCGGGLGSTLMTGN